MRRFLYAVSLVGVAWACAGPRPVSTESSATTPTLTFIDDDYERALKEGRSRGVPVFVDSWAPW